MTISRKIGIMLTRSSWIRKMFEEGAKLKAKYGADKVYDFSLGNPNLEPPPIFKEKLLEIINSSQPNSHAYMPNVGYPHVRKAVANYISKESKVDISENEIIMTCGAAGGINVALKAILDPGDEVISPAPYFAEYGFYVDNHGGLFKTVFSNPDFTLDIDRIESTITEKTKAVIINSPNNPTGQVYSEESLSELGGLLREKSAKLNRTIYLISDEPYRKIVYDDTKIPYIYDIYEDSIIVHSYSKDISIPGERIGFIAISPKAQYKDDLFNAMAHANRILGFVNAPALIQKVVAEIQGITVDISEYKRKRDMLCEGLRSYGYNFIVPKGAFYVFPECPIPDDIRFVQGLVEENILAVPGSGFGAPGYFRLAFCVSDETIINAIPGFNRVMERY
ncbi:MAG: pyridoxal phosphate-dependent aminotransferase [Desulfobacterales bacterium]|nr:pyridoxal phosphate-dependent aminotransferase [Desulfobacterales bacterium]